MERLSQNFEEYARNAQRIDSAATLRDWRLSEGEKSLKEADMERLNLYDQFGKRDGEPADNYWEKPIPHAGIDPEARYLINVDPLASEIDAHDDAEQTLLKAQSFLGILQ